MANDQILENNKAIAEFMGGVYKKHPYNLYNNMGYELSGVWYSDEVIKYHSSWDWLMPVVEKIENICKYSIIQRLPNGYACSFVNQLTDHVTLDTAIYTKIECVYGACVKFIYHYNAIKNTPS